MFTLVNRLMPAKMDGPIKQSCFFSHWKCEEAQGRIRKVFCGASYPDEISGRFALDLMIVEFQE